MENNNEKENDPVNHPAHYTQASPTVEPIDFLRYLPFSLGNALKYIIRAEHKGNAEQDLDKAVWYLNDFAENGWSCDCHDVPFRVTLDSRASSMLMWLCSQYDEIAYLFESVGYDLWNKYVFEVRYERIKSVAASL